MGSQEQGGGGKWWPVRLEDVLKVDADEDGVGGDDVGGGGAEEIEGF